MLRFRVIVYDMVCDYNDPKSSDSGLRWLEVSVLEAARNIETQW